MRLRWFRRQSLAPRVSRPHPALWAAGSVAVLGSSAVVALWGAEIPLGALTPRAATGVVAAALAVTALVTFRRFLYDRLATRPGPIEIASFSGDPPEDSGLERSDLLAEFRRTLAEMTLTAPEPVPGEASSRAVVEDVRSAVEGDHGAVATAVLVMLSVLQVRRAYSVSVQVLSSNDERCGLSVHVARLPGGRGDVEIVWAADWRTAAQRAAHVVGAFLIPRSRLSKRDPWRAWRGVRMPPELFHQSQLAARFIRERRYERALDALHAALRVDPQNPYLRIDLGQVQEQAGLHLDAAATYADVIAVEAWFDGRLWRRLRRILSDGTTGAPPARVGRRRNGPNALLIARYRVVTRLGAADELAAQWTREEQPTGGRNGRRHAERAAMTQRLLVWLNSYAIGYERGDDWVDRSSQKGTVLLDRVQDYEAHAGRLVHLIRWVGRVEAEALADDYRWSRGRRRPGLAINQASVQLLALCATLQEQRARHVFYPEETQGWWPATPDQLDLRIGRSLRRKPRFARTWTEYYNAACITSVALNGALGDDGEARRTRAVLSLQAVRHLERAVRSTDSGYVGRFSQWLATGDRDLDALRRTPPFVDFLDRYLPTPEPRTARPGVELIALLMSAHTSQLLLHWCDRRAEFWARAVGERKRPDQIEAELALEAGAVALTLDYVTHDRHWQTRMKLIRASDAFCRRTGLHRVEDRFPRFQDDPRVVALADDPEARREADDDADRYFRSVVEARTRVLLAIAEDLRARTQALEERAPDPAGCRSFWVRLGSSLCRGLGIPEQIHHGLSDLPYVSAPPDAARQDPETPSGLETET